MTPTFEELVAFTKEIEGRPIYTLKQARPFLAKVESGQLKFTPVKSASTRSAQTVKVKSVLKRLADTGSFEPGHYKEFSFNASYILALAFAWQARGK